LAIQIFINEDFILKDQVELRKEVQNVKEARKEGKWEITRNPKHQVELRKEVQKIKEVIKKGKWEIIN